MMGTLLLKDRERNFQSIGFYCPGKFLRRKDGPGLPAAKEGLLCGFLFIPWDVGWATRKPGRSPQHCWQYQCECKPPSLSADLALLFPNEKVWFVSLQPLGGGRPLDDCAESLGSWSASLCPASERCRLLQDWSVVQSALVTRAGVAFPAKFVGTSFVAISRPIVLFEVFFFFCLCSIPSLWKLLLLGCALRVLISSLPCRPPHPRPQG